MGLLDVTNESLDKISYDVGTNISARQVHIVQVNLARFCSMRAMMSQDLCNEYLTEQMESINRVTRWFGDHSCYYIANPTNETLEQVKEFAKTTGIELPPHLTLVSRQNGDPMPKIYRHYCAELTDNISSYTMRTINASVPIPIVAYSAPYGDTYSPSVSAGWGLEALTLILDNVSTIPDYIAWKNKDGFYQWACPIEYIYFINSPNLSKEIRNLPYVTVLDHCDNSLF